MELSGPDWTWWLGFNLLVMALLALDLGLFNRKNHVVGVRESLIWSGVWIVLSLVFCYFAIYRPAGDEAALAFLTGYVIEKALSVDNLFVFLVLFSYFRVPQAYQHKVLFYGILGALVMRAVFILLGVELIHRVHWIIYVFGAFLIYTGIKVAREHGNDTDPEANIAVRLARRFIPVTSEYHRSRFFVRINGVRHATPMFLVLLAVETTDVIFAVDSIPAILAITDDAFIVYTSNVCAILGLRSLYFALAALMRLFRFLQYGLAFILVFVGAKMLLQDWYKIPVGVSLAVVLGTLIVSILYSIWHARRYPEEIAPDQNPGNVPPAIPAPADR